MIYTLSHKVSTTVTSCLTCATNVHNLEGKQDLLKYEYPTKPRTFDGLSQAPAKSILIELTDQLQEVNYIRGRSEVVKIVKNWLELTSQQIQVEP